MIVGPNDRTITSEDSGWQCHLNMGIGVTGASTPRSLVCERPLGSGFHGDVVPMGIYSQFHTWHRISRYTV